MQADGAVFMQEDRADNAFVCASVEFLTIGEREDGWHTDCGASQLHAAVTVFGSRTVLVKLDQPPLLPRSFYVGNLCAVAETTSDPVATCQVCAAARAVFKCMGCAQRVCKRCGLDGWSCLACDNGYHFNAGEAYDDKNEHKFEDHGGNSDGQTLSEAN